MIPGIRAADEPPSTVGRLPSRCLVVHWHSFPDFEVDDSSRVNRFNRIGSYEWKRLHLDPNEVNMITAVEASRKCRAARSLLRLASAEDLRNAAALGLSTVVARRIAERPVPRLTAPPMTCSAGP